VKAAKSAAQARAGSRLAESHFAAERERAYAPRGHALLLTALLLLITHPTRSSTPMATAPDPELAAGPPKASTRLSSAPSIGRSLTIFTRTDEKLVRACVRACVCVCVCV